MNIHKQKALDWIQSKSAHSAFIGTKFLDVNRSTKIQEIINPCDETILTRVIDTSKEDIDTAVLKSKEAYHHHWKIMAPRTRAMYLQKIAQCIRDNAEELAAIESLQNGKTFQESLVDDLSETADVFDYYAGWTDKFYSEVCPVQPGFLNYTLHESLGVCALIVPWNFPLLLAAWKIAPALAMGNTAIVKPATFTPLSMLRLCEYIYAKNILPEGVLQVVVGGAEVGETLCKHEDIAKVSFTGSTGIGKLVATSAAQSNLKATSLELGGKSANIIFEDVPDLNAALDRSFTAMFSHKAEKCSEPTRWIIHRKHYAHALDYLKAKASSVKLGDAFEKGVDQGAQCHRDHFNKIKSYIDIGLKEGAKLLCGQENLVTPAKITRSGFFISPTIFYDVDPAKRLAQEEIFGPVLSIIPFEEEEEAIQIANFSRYGLAAGFWSKDVSRVHRLAHRLEAGMIFINRYGCYDFASPFGGFKESGWGKEMAIHSLSHYTKLKSVWIKYD